MFIKLFSILSLTFLLSMNGMASLNQADSNRIYNYSSLTELNRVMQDKMSLTKDQTPVVANINQEYLTRKNAILQTPDMLGQKTALLACWDKWMQSLSKQLTKEQMNIFLNWQSKVDLLSDQII